jgi:hypothetical protein
MRAKKSPEAHHTNPVCKATAMAASGSSWTFLLTRYNKKAVFSSILYLVKVHQI